MSETHKIAAILVADVFSYSRLAGCTVLMQALSYASSSGSRTSTSGLICVRSSGMKRRCVRTHNSLELVRGEMALQAAHRPARVGAGACADRFPLFFEACFVASASFRTNILAPNGGRDLT